MMKFDTLRVDNVKPTILCIDDDVEVVASLTEILVRSGYSTECCTNARSAMDSIRSHTPDLIIADIHLGEDNGLVLCEQFRAMRSMSEVPILVLSGADIPDVVQKVRAAGGTYYLRKPFDPEVLLELIDRSLWMPHIVNNQTQATAPALVSHSSFLQRSPIS